MKKLIISLLVIISTFTLSGQVLPGVVASQGGIVGCGTGTDNYGDSSGSTAYGTGTGNYIWYMPVDVVGCGTVLTLKVFISGTVATKGAIYSGASQPTNLLTNGDAGEITTTSDAWNTWTFSTPPTVESATKYWVAILPSATIGLMNSGGDLTAYYQSRTYADGFPATASGLSSVASRNTNAYIVVQHP